MDQTLLDRCTREICDLHDFFQGWFRGSISESAATFQRFTGVLDEQFTIINPAGLLTARPALLDALRGAYHKQSGIRIWTQNYQLRQQIGAVTLCTYEEWQEIPTQTATKTTARISSVLFRQADDAPNGLVWLHVHESWIDAQ